MFQHEADSYYYFSRPTYPVLWQIGTKVSDEHNAAIFRVEDGGVVFKEKTI
jgi:hypothetical protein